MTANHCQNDYHSSLRASGSRRRSIALIAVCLFLLVLYTIRVTFVRSDHIYHRFSQPDLLPPRAPSPSAIESQTLAQEPLHIQPSNVATIIEARPLTNLAPLILHFATVLGPDWPIVIFTTNPNTAPNSAPFVRALDAGRITIKKLPPNISFNVRDEVSEFLTSAWLWEALAPAPYVLLFQADSILCANSEARVDDFLKFDFVGAPIRPGMGYGDEGMNGGLSLRKRSLILEIVNKWNWKEERKVAVDAMYPPVAYEDQWFYRKMTLMNIEAINDHADEEDGEGREWITWEPRVKLPTPEEAMRFSVETMWYERPLGYHQVAHWHLERKKEIDQWCPEHRMATMDKISNA